MTANESGAAANGKRLHVACNAYSWYVFYEREGRDFYAELDAGLGELAAAALDGYEPIINEPGDIDRLVPLLKKHGIEMRSFYVNSSLHEKAEAEKSLRAILAIGQRAKAAGTRIIVTNPNPISWGGGEAKSDEQLGIQAEMLDKLGEKLRGIDITLAYHNHDMELKNAAREFHHMMLGTDPANMTLCLDAHWMYRGSGNSSVALFDILKLYGGRVSELHLRQSVGGIWSETFATGDIDYSRVAEYLVEINVKPHIVLEQACEEGTPKTMSPLEAFTQSATNTRKVFARFA